MAKKEGLLAKTKRRMKELWYGERTYTKGHKKPISKVKAKAKKLDYTKMKKTARSLKTERGLKAAGLTDAEIAKFYPKGKKK